jgi:hypothetical protein
MPVATPSSPLTGASYTELGLMSAGVMDYSRYHFRSEVDWLELEIEILSPTQAWRISKASGLPFARPCDQLTGEPLPAARENEPTTLFRMKIQDPLNCGSAGRIIAKLNKTYPLAFPPTVVGIEVALDGYSNALSRDELVLLTAHFYKFLTNVPSDNHRTYRRHREFVDGITSFDTLIQMISEGYQVGVGNKADDLYLHSYLKTTDRVRYGIAEPLPIEEHRARIEITIQGAALPRHTLDEWQTFDFRTLTPYFNFRMLKPELNKFSSHALQKIAKVTGRYTAAQKRRLRTRNEFSSATLADRKLNDISKGALRRLSDRWARSVES